MSKNIIVSTDGTWNTPDQTDRGRVVPSNVVKISRAVADQSPTGDEQICYYDTGVGTAGWLDKIRGGAVGRGLGVNILQAYDFVCRLYEPDDKLYLFGFSRGAFTIRSLAGMVGRCGIRKDLAGVDTKTKKQLLNETFELYRQKPSDDTKQKAKAFREANCHGSTEIHFVGVWDTVGALGIPVKGLKWIARRKFKFYNPRLGPHIKNAYHAIAIDERRGPFEPTLWETQNVVPGQVVQQVWFPGVHSNIGGGYVDRGLSDRTLLWMAIKAYESGLGLDGAYIARRVDPNYHGEMRDSMSAFYKALTPIIRDIGQAPGVNQEIHFSALRRRQHSTNNYRAENLIKAIDQNVSVAQAMTGETNHAEYFGDSAIFPPVGTPQTFRPDPI